MRRIITTSRARPAPPANLADPEDSADDTLGMDPIPEARYLRFGPTDTIQELQTEFNE